MTFTREKLGVSSGQGSDRKVEGSVLGAENSAPWPSWAGEKPGAQRDWRVTGPKGS